MALIFISKTMMPIRKVLGKQNTRVLSFMMFDENREKMVFKVFSLVVYCIVNNYVCADHLCYPQTKFHVSNKGF